MAVATRGRPKSKAEFNQEAADRAVSFISALKHSTGEYAGQSFMLQDWQRGIIETLFGTLNPDGTRQYRTCYITVARKNGKTELGAGVGLYLLVADNEPGAQIYSAASDRAQASLIYNAAAPMVRQSGALSKRLKDIASQKRLVDYKSNSFYQVLSAEAYSKHGLNAHAILFDELHSQPNRDLWDVLTTSTGARRQPLTFVMTTAGYDRNTIGWEIHDYACKVRDGIIKDPTFLPVIYQTPDDADWNDEKNWHLANPALGTFRKIDEMRALYNKARETPALEMTFRRLYLNQWVNSVQRWLPMDKWDECSDAPEELNGRPCYAGLDLAATTDLAALSLVFPREDSYDILMRFWIPEDGAHEKERKDRVPYQQWAKQGYITLTPGNVIDYDYIAHELKTLREQYDIREVAFDRWGATKLSQDLTEAEFTMVPFGQGFVSMSAPTKELMSIVLSKKLRHGGHPILRWNADNLVVQMDPAGNLKPDKAKATQKIDGMVALIMALDRATRHAADYGRSVYDGRGVLSL
jgi:phage terminase large subunit-like protein